MGYRKHPVEQWTRYGAAVVLCPRCQLRRLYGRGPVCLACRMDERDQENQERRRRAQAAIRRLSVGYDYQEGANGHQD